MGITSNAIGSDSISLKFLKLLLPLIMFFMYLTMLSHARSFRCLSYWTFRRRLIVWTIIYFWDMVFTFLNGRSMVIDVDVLSFNRVFFSQKKETCLSRLKKFLWSNCIF
jgi:hypothetical protein